MKRLTWPLFPYGGDYNPEQWPRETWEEDADLMVKAGWNVATVPVFGWAALEPAEGQYQFDWLDTVVETLHKRGIRICLATATASVPAWLPQAYPDVLVVNEDGRRVRHGGRHTFCPSSPNYQRLSRALAEQVAARYAGHPATLLVHVNNEYGVRCYCDQCGAAFREWLKARYESLDELNFKWNTAFWSHTYTSWDQIEPPTRISEGSIQALKLDYARFQNEAVLNLYIKEAEAFRRQAPDLPVTTNLMGAFYYMDYHVWAPHLDVASWDCYPTYDADPSQPAFHHTVTRGIKEGQSFLLMEQSPSQQNWAPYNRLKAPGQLRLQSWQAVAHGADSVMYFQWRRGRGGIEKLHGAVMEHGGTSENRVFKEVAALGAELAKTGPIVQGSRSTAKVALVFDWPNWWDLSFTSGPSRDLNYQKVVQDWFSALWRLGIQAEIVAPQADFSRFDVILCPVLTMLRPDDAARIEERVKQGALLVATSFTGLVDENDLVYLEGAPGPWRSMLGISVEETDALPPELPNAVEWAGESEDSEAVLLADRIRLEGAKVEGRYAEDFYSGEPAVTSHPWGEGSAWYMACLMEGASLQNLLRWICSLKGISSPLNGGFAPPEGVEAVERQSEDGVVRLFLLNHGRSSAEVGLREGSWKDLLTGKTASGRIVLASRQVAIMEPQA